jgi:hypothetical protein
MPTAHQHLVRFEYFNDAQVMMQELEDRFRCNGFYVVEDHDWIVLASGEALNLHVPTIRSFCEAWKLGRLSWR